MVGIFSRFSASRNGHSRTQSARFSASRNGQSRTRSALDERQVSPRNSEATAAAAAATTTGAALAAAHGIEIAVEFKPLEHPTEPPDNDQPIQCPLPEPSILNDGRIWKERVSAGVRRQPELPAMQEGTPMESETVGTKPRRPSNRMILPSVSAPEHNILKLLEECNASGI